MNEIIETNTEQVALALLEQQIINQCRIQAQSFAETGKLLKKIKDGKEYKDGITITPANIFEHVAAGGELCSTSAANIGEYTDIFEKYVLPLQFLSEGCLRRLPAEPGTPSPAERNVLLSIRS